MFLIAGLIISLLIYLYMRSTSERHRLVTREVEIKTREMTELIDQNRTILLNAMIGIPVSYTHLNRRAKIAVSGLSDSVTDNILAAKL